MTNLDIMWEIIKKLAESDTTYDTVMGDQECLFCNGGQDYSNSKYLHETTCIVIEARRLIRQRGLV